MNRRHSEPQYFYNRLVVANKGPTGPCWVIGTNGYNHFTCISLSLVCEQNALRCFARTIKLMTPFGCTFNHKLTEKRNSFLSQVSVVILVNFHYNWVESKKLQLNQKIFSTLDYITFGDGFCISHSFRPISTRSDANGFGRLLALNRHWISRSLRPQPWRHSNRVLYSYRHCRPQKIELMNRKRAVFCRYIQISTIHL